MGKEILSRFWSKVEKTPTCWLWKGTLGSDGYGIFWVRKNCSVGAHRFSLLTLKKMPLESSRKVLHKCDVRLCVNPSHLFLGSPADNVADMVSKGRNVRGVMCATSKLLKDSQAVQIRLLYSRGGKSISQLAKMYETSNRSIRAILKGERWRHVGGPIEVDDLRKGNGGWNRGGRNG